MECSALCIDSLQNIKKVKLVALQASQCIIREETASSEDKYYDIKLLKGFI